MALFHRYEFLFLCAFTLIFSSKQLFISCFLVDFKIKSFNRQYTSRASIEKEFWAEKIQYFDLNAPVTSTAVNTRNLPLFVLQGAFFPQGITYLNVFEMKYRTMMFDVANNDDMFGYIHSNPQTGQLAAVGTLCKITDRQLLEDGRQYIALEGKSRFQVTKILKTLPYILAEVDLDYIDEPVDEVVANKVEMETYDALKIYIRLMRTYDANKDMVVSMSAKRNRPTNLVVYDQVQRRTDFSFSLANMIQMSQSRESQLLLQTTNVVTRLTIEKQILMQASDLVGQQLMEMGVLTAERKDSIKMNTINNAFDEDILPLDFIDSEKAEEKDEWDISNIE